MAKKKELTSGQTSDQNIESINLDILPEVEEGYKPKVECNDLSEFFTPKDFAFMLIDFPKQFEEYKSRLDKNNYSSFGTPIHKYYKKFRLYIYPTFKHWSSNTIYDEVKFVFNVTSKKLTFTEVKEMGYQAFREFLLDSAKIYEFPTDLSVKPAGVDDFFFDTCVKIDKQIENAQASFENTCCYLNDIKLSKGNIERYGCKDIYDFAERRFGIGRTSTKNFLAIHEKFMSGVVLKEDYRGYKQSQLMELLPVSDDVIKSSFKPEMSVKQIREKKKELVGTLSDKEDKKKKEKTAKVQTVKIEVPTFVEFYESNFRHEANDYNDGYNEALRDVLELLSSESGVVIKVNV